MEENFDIKNLSNEDLLELHKKVVEHLDYLKQSILTIEEEEDGGEENEQSGE